MTNQKEIQDFHEGLQKISDIACIVGKDIRKTSKAIEQFQKFFIEKFNPVKK